MTHDINSVLPPPLPMVIRHLIHAALPLLGIACMLTIIYRPAFLALILEYTFPNAAEHIYERRPLSLLFRDHLLMVGISCLMATMIGVAMGIFLTRGVGRDFLPLFRNLVSLLQTFPPVAVLVLVAPFLGFGIEPTIVALFLFSILPVLNNTISGIRSVPAPVIDASLGMGMTPWQILTRVELPVAARVISAGIRTAMIINIGTATIGAVVGAGGFGVIIIAGLVRNNSAFIFSGAVVTALLALTANWLFLQFERRFYSPREQNE